jgi:[acyl-carrier-protein] S-malonyltransferase
MGKLALLFPGQGSQHAGMGKALAEAFPVARDAFDQADQALGFPLSRLCFEGPEEELKLTANTQPAILACSVAGYRVLEERGIGQYMQEAVPEGEGAMAAILGLPADKVSEVCSQAAKGEVVAAANLNSPGQVVISGHRTAVERAMQAAKSAGAKRAVRLPVSAPFHCSLLKPAADRLAAHFNDISFQDLEIPLVSNVIADLVRTGAEARDALVRQVPAPVRWEESVRKLIELGCDTFVEVGPGKVLTGLLRQIDRSKTGLNVEDSASLETTLARLGEMKGEAAS